MTPEELARQKIDRMFSDAGWAVVDRDHFSPEDSAVAVEEGLMNGNLEAIISCLSTARQLVCLKPSAKK